MTSKCNRSTQKKRKRKKKKKRKRKKKKKKKKKEKKKKKKEKKKAHYKSLTGCLKKESFSFQKALTRGHIILNHVRMKDDI